VRRARGPAEACDADSNGPLRLPCPPAICSATHPPRSTTPPSQSSEPRHRRADASPPYASPLLPCRCAGARRATVRCRSCSGARCWRAWRGCWPQWAASCGRARARRSRRAAQCRFYTQGQFVVNSSDPPHSESHICWVESGGSTVLVTVPHTPLQDPNRPQLDRNVKCTRKSRGGAGKKVQTHMFRGRQITLPDREIPLLLCYL
jgi:hypothetical protein